MCAAIEALTKKPNGKNDFIFISNILGEELKELLYAQNTGLRHRLSHGEYFSGSESHNYVEEIHRKIIEYFNSKIFSKKFLNEKVVHPQRHFFGNKGFGDLFIKQRDSATQISLKKLLQDFNQTFPAVPEHYEIIDPPKSIKE